MPSDCAQSGTRSVRASIAAPATRPTARMHWISQVQLLEDRRQRRRGQQRGAGRHQADVAAARSLRNLP